MVAVKLQSFGGMVPAVDSQLLPQNAASLNRNVWVNSGALEGYRDFELVYTPSSSAVQRVFRVPIDQVDSTRIPNSYWLEFNTTAVDVVQSPTIDDQFERFYWAYNIGPPQYNTKARIAAGDPSLLLGVPAPATAPGVVVTGGSGPTETRSYVYTWVTDFGEEGPPSPPSLDTENSDGSWELTLTAPGASGTDRLLDLVRIYRTVSGTGGETDYFFVGEQDISILTFTDPGNDVTGNRLLESLFWYPPPAELEGFAVMPNGIIAGWKGSEIWFCEPYRPHAWPAPYQISVESDVVGCGVIGQTLIACTEGAPFAVSGVNPASMAVSRLGTFEPCVSRGSVVSTSAGVAYASSNGLVLASPGGAAVITMHLVEREDWDELLYLPTIFGAPLNGGYITFGSTAIGCFADHAFNTDAFLQLDLSGATTGAYIYPNDNRIAYTILEAEEPVRSVYTDYWTGEVFVHQDSGVYWVHQSSRNPGAHQPYLWRSKTLETPNSRNFEAMRVYFSEFSDTPDLNPVQNTSPVQTLQPDQWGLIRIYADGELKFTRELRTNGEFFRLPSGFKATFWEIEVEARVRVNSIEIATSARELGSV